MKRAVREVACPTCGRMSPFEPTNRWRPFCSERCKGIDLGAWASDSYVIGGNSQDSPPDQSDEPPFSRS